MLFAFSCRNTWPAYAHDLSSSQLEYEAKLALCVCVVVCMYLVDCLGVK